MNLPPNMMKSYFLVCFSLLLALSGCAHKGDKIPSDENASKASSNPSDEIAWTVLNESGTPGSGVEKVEYGDIGRSGDLVSFKRKLTTQSAGIQTVTQTVEEMHCIQKNYRILSGERRITLTDGTTKRLTFDGSLDWKPTTEKSVGKGGMTLMGRLCQTP